MPQVRRNKELKKDISVFQSSSAFHNSTGSNWKPAAQVQPGTDKQNKPQTPSLTFLAPPALVMDVSKSHFGASGPSEPKPQGRASLAAVIPTPAPAAAQDCAGHVCQAPSPSERTS